MSKFEFFKINVFLRVYTWIKIPLIGFCSPKLMELTDRRLVLKIPLGYRTRNHLKSMYFGALAIGAEMSIVLIAILKIKEHTDAGGDRIDFVFKDFKIDFLKRPDGDVHFISDDIQTVVAQVGEAKNSLERINKTMKGYAVVPSIDPNERVAEFELTLSLKRRPRKNK
jgi:hypothetical protein